MKIAFIMTLFTADMAGSQEVRKMQIAVHITHCAMLEDWRLAYKNAKTEFALTVADRLLRDYEKAQAVAVEKAYATVDDFLLADIDGRFFNPLQVDLVVKLIDDVTVYLRDRRDISAQKRGAKTLMHVFGLLTDIF